MFIYLLIESLSSSLSNDSFSLRTKPSFPSDHFLSFSLFTTFLFREASCSSSDQSAEFAHRCSKCSMAFRTDAQLQTHSLQHVFNTFHKCPTCGDSFDENNIMVSDQPLINLYQLHSQSHMLEHSKEECDMCSETFPSKEAYLTHLNSARHLQLAKKKLESSLVDLNSHQVLTVSTVILPSLPTLQASEKLFTVPLTTFIIFN